MSWQGFLRAATAPDEVERIVVTGVKWMWDFRYSNGWMSRELHLPVDRPVELLLRSRDVEHRLVIPELNVDAPALPDQDRRVWLQSRDTGTFELRCADYCGKDFKFMKAEVVVHPPGDYERYLQDARPELDLPPAELGEHLYEVRGCKVCHSTDGSESQGPTYQGIWGQTRELADGSKAVVDGNYVRRSIIDPQHHVRAGFSPVMPSFRDKLSDREIAGIIEFIKSLQ